MKKLLEKIKLKLKKWWKENIVDDCPEHLNDIF
jgi:hypothetical protein